MSQLDLSNYHLTFSDEFNGTTLDTGTWGTSFGNGAVRTLGTGESEAYVEPSYKGLGINPFSESGGALTISANPTPPADLSAVGEPYTSGMITTQQTWSQEYGYFEMRAKLPADDGMWPAFWMLPEGYLPGAEVDTFEQLGKDPGTIHQSIHYPNQGGAGQMFDTSVDTASQYHTYGFQWTPSTMTFYVDGNSTGTVANTINQTMYMIGNLAVGGSWAGNPDASTTWPGQMNIDYIRAYSTDPNIPAIGPNPVTPPPSPYPTGGGSPPPPPPPPGPPVANNDSGFVATENTALYIPASTLLANDTDPNGETISITGVSSPTHGTATLLTQPEAGTQTVQFTPTTGYTGPAGFSYSIADTHGGTASANVSLQVDAPTPPPPPPATGPDDTLVLNLSEDAFKGNAKARVFIDGHRLGDTLTVTASHSAGKFQEFDISMAGITAGLHTVGVKFINDAYGGTPSTDRNLYVSPIQVGTQTPSGVTNTTTYGSGIQELFRTGDTATFTNVLISH